MKPMNANHETNQQQPGAENHVNHWFRRPRESAPRSAPAWRSPAIRLWAAVLLAVGASVSCETTSSPPPPAEAYVSRPSTTLAPGDEIVVTFASAPELNTRQKIQPNGKVSLPTIGEISASGKSITSLQEQMTALYKPHLQDPRVVVSLVGSAAGVYVSGAVQRPGKVPLDRPMTALEAVMESGGFSPVANPSKVIIVRNQGGKSKNYLLNFSEALAGTESTPFYLRPYDVIYVKERLW
jgi:polysaccharide export outer membrane protein